MVLIHKAFQYQITFWGLRTIGTGIKIDIGGGQGGRLNAPQDGVTSIPKLGLSCLHYSFCSMVVMICSTLWFFPCVSSSSHLRTGKVYPSSVLAAFIYLLFWLEDWYTSHVSLLLVWRW